MNNLLRFSTGNKKLLALATFLGYKYSEVTSFDLPAGYTCPAADECQSFADRETGKITDGVNCKFRCYAASVEVRYPSARKAHWHNYDILRKLTQKQMIDAILRSLPENIKILRIHTSGDFFSKRYFLAWVEIAKIRTDIQFFGYTKILPYVSYSKPSNFHLVYSHGGKMDDRLTNEPVVYVVKNVEEAIKRGLYAVCVNNPADDFQMIMSGQTFALCVHGTQPAKRG